MTLVLLLCTCGSLDESDLLGTGTSISLVIQNPDESASGSAKAVDGLSSKFTASKSAASLGVTSCTITCGSVSKTVSFASGTSQIETTLDCTTGSSVTINLICTDSDKGSNGVDFGFIGSTTVSLASSSTVTINGRFLNQATRSSGDCRYCKIAQDNNTQMFFECGASSNLTDSQKTTFNSYIEFQAANSATSSSTVDASSDGLQSTKGNPYIQIGGGLNAPSCWLYNTSDAKQLRGTGSWVTDADGNTKGRCVFGVTQMIQRDGDRNARFAASCTVDGSTYVLTPSSGRMAEWKTSGAANSDVASLTANSGSCTSVNECSSGFCRGATSCAAVPTAQLTSSDTFSHVAGQDSSECGATCANGTANGNSTTARFNGPGGICISPNGNRIYVVDTTNEAIRLIDLTLASTNASFVTLFCGQIGTAGSTNGACATEALFSIPATCAVNADNTSLFVAETANDCIREINISAQTVTTLAGNCGTAGNVNGTGTAAQFNNPFLGPITSSGTLYVADFGNDAIRQVTSGGVVTTLVSMTDPAGLTMDSTETFLYVLSGATLVRVNIATAATTTLVSSGLSNPNFITIDPSNDVVYITGGTPTHTLSRVDLGTLTVTNIAGSSGTSGVTLSTGTDSRFNDPLSLAFNPAGTTLYLIEAGNHRVVQMQ